MAVNANYVNNASVAVLDINITSTDTSVTVTNFSGWPVSTPYWAEIGRDTSSAEIVKVTAVAGSTLTIARGQDGTTASAHNIGDNFEHVIPAQLPNLVESHVDSTSAHGVGSALVGVTDAQSLTSKEYRGSHVHTYSDANPAAPAAGYKVNADSTAARDGFVVNNTAADANKRAYALDQSGTPRFEVFQDGTVKIAPVGATRDALDVDGNLDVLSDHFVHGELYLYGSLSNPGGANPVTVSDTQGLTVTNKLTAGTLTNEGVSHRPFGWTYITSGGSGATGNIIIDLTAGGVFPAGTFNMIRIFVEGQFDTGNDRILCRINGDSTSIYNQGYTRRQLSTGNLAGSSASTAGSFVGGWWSAFAGNNTEIILHKTDVSSEVPMRFVGNRAGSSGFDGNREVIHGHCSLESARLVDSFHIFAPTGVNLTSNRWHAEGFRTP